MSPTQLLLFLALALATPQPRHAATARDFLANLPGAYVGAVPPMATLNGNLDNYDVNFGSGQKPAAYVLYLKFPLSLHTAQELADNDNIMTQIGTRNAIALVTLEPWSGLGAIAQSDLDYLSTKLAQWEKTMKVTMIVRFAHEMNGAWYPWAQRPLQYKDMFTRIAAVVHNSTCRGATLWAPNEAAGYPFNGGTYSIMGGSSGIQCTSADFTNPSTECYALDTNHDGVVDLADDPFTPYYPTNTADDIVDMVGLSVYHFGDPTGVHTIPDSDKLYHSVTAGPPTWPFYNMFAVNRDKSFILPETGAMWDTQYSTTCPTSTTTTSSSTGRKLLGSSSNSSSARKMLAASRRLTAAIAVPTAAAALGTNTASSDFELTPETVFTGRTNASSAARAAFNMHYQRNGFAYSGSYSSRVMVNAAGSQPWDIQVNSINWNLQAGRSYQARLWVRADRSTTIQFAWTNMATYQSEVLKTEPVTTTFRNIFLPPLSPSASGPYQLQINMGTAATGTNFYIDGAEVYDALIASASSEFESLPQSVFEQRLQGSAAANFDWSSFESAAVGNASARIQVAQVNAVQNFWDIQASTKDVLLAGGRNYTARGFIRADRATSVTVTWTRTSDWTAVISQPQAVTTTWQEFNLPLLSLATDATYQLQVGMGNAAVGTVIYLDSIQVYDGPAPARQINPPSQPPPPPPQTPSPSPTPNPPTTTSPSPPPSTDSKVLEASSDFEVVPNTVFAGNAAAPAAANFDLGSTLAANSGTRSARVQVVTPSSSAPWNIQLTTANVMLQAGRTYKTSLWVMASRADQIQISWTNTVTWSAALLLNQPVSTYWTKITLPPYTPTTAGTYQLQINMAAAQAGTVFYVDDVTVTNGPCYIPSELEIKQAWWQQVYIPPTAANPMSKLKLACWFDIKKPEAAVQNHIVDWTISLNSTIRDAFMSYIADPNVANRWRMLGGYQVDRASQPLCTI